MTPTERKLNQLLRTVSETGPQEAPANVEQALLAAFHQRQNKRRTSRWAAFAIAAGLGVVALLRLTSTVAAPPVVSIATAQPDTSEFIALADADTSTPLEHATIVRVRLPLSDFRDIGLAINEQNAAVRVQADVLLGQDGLARAVRFVQ